MYRNRTRLIEALWDYVANAPNYESSANAADPLHVGRAYNPALLCDLFVHGVPVRIDGRPMITAAAFMAHCESAVMPIMPLEFHKLMADVRFTQMHMRYGKRPRRCWYGAPRVPSVGDSDNRAEWYARLRENATTSNTDVIKRFLRGVPAETIGHFDSVQLVRKAGVDMCVFPLALFEQWCACRADLRDKPLDILRSSGCQNRQIRISGRVARRWTAPKEWMSANP